MPWGAAVTWEMITKECSYSLAFSITAMQMFFTCVPAEATV